MHKDRLEECLWLTSLKQEQKQAHENSMQEYICQNLEKTIDSLQTSFFNNQKSQKHVLLDFGVLQS